MGERTVRRPVPEAATVGPYLRDLSNGRVVPLSGSPLVIGRDRECTLFLDDKLASRRHATIELSPEGDGFAVRDLGSTNGTYVNNERIETRPLRHGDRILVGNALFLFAIRPTSSAAGRAFIPEETSLPPETLSLDVGGLDRTRIFAAGPDGREQFGALVRFLQETVGVLQFEQLIGMALEFLFGNFDADRALFFSMEQGGDPQLQGLRLRHPEEKEMPRVSRTILERVRKNGEAILSSDAARDDRFAATESLVGTLERTILCAPMKSKDRLLGILYVDRIGRPYTEEDLARLGALAGTLAVASENAHLYDRLVEANSFSQTVLACLGSGVLVIDATGRVTGINLPALEILGLEERELLHRSIAEIEWITPLAELLLATAVEGGRHERAEVELLRPDGVRLPLGITIRPLRDPHGHRIGAVANFRDLTPIRDLEEQVRRSQRLAALGEMAAGIAHEVRNPLNSIRGFVELMKESAVGESARFADVVIGEVDRINRIVQDMLDFARQRPFRTGRLDWVRETRDLLALQENRIAEAKIRTSVDLPEEAPVLAHPEKLRQVALNVLRNAIEALEEVPEDRRRLSIGIEPADDGAAWTLAIADTGPGMGPDVRDRIFDPFFTGKDHGTGLGLSICQSIVEGHGGTIRVESAPGEGAVFRITIPAAGR